MSIEKETLHYHIRHVVHIQTEKETCIIISIGFGQTQF